MKRFFLIISACVLTCSVCGSLMSQTTYDYDPNSKTEAMSIFFVDGMDVTFPDIQKLLDSMGNEAAQINFAINSGLFCYNPKAKVHYPCGLLIQDGKLFTRLTDRFSNYASYVEKYDGHGNKLTSPVIKKYDQNFDTRNGVFFITEDSTGKAIANILCTSSKEYATLGQNNGCIGKEAFIDGFVDDDTVLTYKKDRIKFAVQSGPLLALNGVVLAKSTAVSVARAAVCITQNGNVRLIYDNDATLKGFADKYTVGNNPCVSILHLDGAIATAYNSTDKIYATKDSNEKAGMMSIVALPQTKVASFAISPAELKLSLDVTSIDALKTKVPTLKFAINAGGVDVGNKPLGLRVSNSSKLSDIGTYSGQSRAGFFCIDAQNIPHIELKDPEKYVVYKNDPLTALTSDYSTVSFDAGSICKNTSALTLATQSYPVIIKDGVLLGSGVADKHARSAICIKANKDLLIVYSQGQNNSLEKLSPYFFAKHLKAMGCEDALMLQSSDRLCYYDGTKQVCGKDTWKNQMFGGILYN